MYSNVRQCYPRDRPTNGKLHDMHQLENKPVYIIQSAFIIGLIFSHRFTSVQFNLIYILFFICVLVFVFGQVIYKLYPLAAYRVGYFQITV